MRRALVALLTLAALAPMSAAARTTRIDPPSAGPGRYNVALILTDDQSREAGSLAAMPWLSSQPWTEFTQASFNTSLCCPSRATLLTGRYGHEHGVIDNDHPAVLDDTHTIATALTAAGYTTGLVGKYLNGYGHDYYAGCGQPPGWSWWSAITSGGNYRDFTTCENGVERRETDHSVNADDYFVDRAVDFLQQAPERKPWFLWLSTRASHSPRLPCDAHAADTFPTLPYRAPSFNEPDVSDKPAWVQALSPVDVERQDRDRLNSYRTLRCLDDRLDDLHAAVAARGELDETVFVYLTDNGILYGEHRLTKKTCAYEECITTHMRVGWPGRIGGTVDEHVSNVDFAPTVLDIANAAPLPSMDGRSWLPLITGAGDPLWPAGRLIEWRGVEGIVPTYWGVREPGWKLVEYDGGDVELYDLAADPFELSNRAGDPLLAVEQTRLHAEMCALAIEACS